MEELMKIETVDKRARVILDFSPQAFERVSAMRDLGAGETEAKVITNALRFYAWGIAREKEGYTVAMVGRDDAYQIHFSGSEHTVTHHKDDQFFQVGHGWSVSVHPVIVRVFRFLFGWMRVK